MTRLVYAGIVATVVIGMAGAAHAQTTSASAQSLEVSSRGDEHARAGEHARAAQVFRRAIQLDETSLRAHVGLSTALFALGRHREALDALRAARAVLGWRPELAIQRASHLTRLQRWQEALTELEAVPDDVPDAYVAHRVRGAAHLRLEQWEPAIEAFDRYLALRPDSADALDAFVKTRLSYALIQHGNYERARAMIGEVLSVAPRRLSARVLLFTALAKQGDCRDALRLYEDLERAVSAVPTLLYDAAVCRFRLGDERQALVLLDDYAARWQLPAHARLLSARAHAALGDTAAAEAAYRAAIDGGLPVEVELARWWTKRGEHRAVAELLGPLAEAGSDDADVLYLAAAALVRTGELARAAAICERLVERRPDVASWLLDGEIRLERAEWQAAEHAFGRAIAADDARNERAAAGLRQALEQRAHLAFRAGDYDDARGLLTRALAADASADRVAYDLALLELARGNAARAIQLLDGRVDRLRQPAKGHLLLGTALVRSGDTRRAQRELEQVLTADGADDALRARALASLAPLLAATAPDRALDLVARARAAGAAPRSLAGPTASAHLALAERAHARDDLGQLRAHLKRVDAARLEPVARVRFDVLRAVASGREKGVASALKRLADIPDAELEQANRADLNTADLRHALALQLGARLIARPGDYRRYLATHAAALRRASSGGSSVARQVLATAYGRLLDWALTQPAPSLARRLARELPPELEAPELEHDAILAATKTRLGHAPFDAKQVATLERLSSKVPVALVNLALDAQQRGDHAKALDYLRRLPDAARTKEIREWIRWKELLHGTR